MTARPTAHPREDLHRFVNQLNVRYNIGVPIPDPTLSLAEKREDRSAESRIYRRLEVHFYTGGIHALTGLLRVFDEKAKEYWSNWVRKPNADSDLLPTTTRPPLAKDLTERVWLQTIFNQILDTAQPVMQSSRSFGRTQSGPAAMGGHAEPEKHSLAKSRSTPHASSRSQSKRRADVQLGDTIKKPKADPDPLRELTASSSLRRRQPVKTSISTNASASSTMRPPSRTTPVNSAGIPEGIFTSFATTSTGISALSAVFSEGAPSGTQDTIVATSQEQARPPLAQASTSFSQDSYGCSSSLDAGLNTLLDDHHQTSREKSTGSKKVRSIIQADVRRVCGRSPSLSKSFSETTVFSSMPSEVEQEALRRTADLEAQKFLPLWPSFPSWLSDAPFPVAWEVMRIGQSCGIDLTVITDLAYCPDWQEQSKLRKSLALNRTFVGKSFPEKSGDVAWEAGLKAAGLPHRSVVPWDQEVVYSASVDFSGNRSTMLKMKPLGVDQSHRLARHYGADRYLELLIPSPDSSNLPTALKDDDSFLQKLVTWLMQPHAFCGRTWAAFYTKDGGSRLPAKDAKDAQLGPPPKPIYFERIFLFAEKAEQGLAVPPYRLSVMLQWALEIKQKDNALQPYKKLFQRLALVLSRTSPVMVFAPEQIKHMAKDILSATGNVMNDGVGRMSPAVARQIRAKLGLTITPSAVQGRLGSAKGMWILDTRLPASSDAIMIETWPSQRKWVQEPKGLDEDHRTLEIRGCASFPKSAAFNLQFLPVIEACAVDKGAMRKAIGTLLRDNLHDELDGQKRALQSSVQYRQWVHENAAHKHDRIVHGNVPFQGGMPSEDEEVMNMMLDAGFDPKANKTLNGITYEMQKRKCEMLFKRMNITVGRSAYLYMVVDFAGVLEADEVHIGFSTAFEADDAWADTMVDGMDVLVARSPAHFISDIQKVKAVFRRELACLKDVIVFSSKGDIPLAEKLSGGDYDGDRAWVCWDARIVDNFENADPPKQPDLSKYMPKDKETFRDLTLKHNKSRSVALKAMISGSLEFNLSKSMLGICTNYKEKLCYDQNSVSSTYAQVLSTVLSNLVDQPKQGIRFTPADFLSLQRDFKFPKPKHGKPCYKDGHWLSEDAPTHIIDYLKFWVAKPTVDRELKSFHAALNDKAPDGAQDWDVDLVTFYKLYEGTTEGRISNPGRSTSKMVECLKIDIKAVQLLWKGPSDEVFPAKVARVYPEWQAIQPREEAVGSLESNTVQRLLHGGEYSNWELLKASTAFWMFCNSGNKSPRFVWQMACQQLCWLKALAVQKNKMHEHGAVMAPRAVLPSMYAALRPDAKYVKQVTARMEGGSHFGLGDDGYQDYDDEMELDERAILD